jgi:acetyl-CoA carboxylase carboxyltransferase component
MRTVRENLTDLLDAGSFIELGSLVVAAQRRRRSLDDLIHHTPADGVITGFGKVSHARFPSAAKVAVIAYDYTVLAGTQGKLNHDKQDRLLDICYKTRTPLLLLAEGGGGRPGDVDVVTAGSLHIKTFSKFAMLSGLVPVIGIIAGRCFAGNAVLLGCCDVIIATKNSNIGMAGPAMIEGGGLGRFAADDIGPSPVQEANGVIDIIAEDESQAIALAKRYLGYFQGNESAWQYASQSKLADSLPRDRLRVYDMRLLIEHLIDDDSGLELRSKFAPNIITMLARIEGKPIGLIANNPGRLGGAIDANAADKAARFVQLCNAHGLPIISLIDTPGNMVGPQAEAQALVRHCCRLFVAGAKVTVPWVSIVIRKAYGLGAMAMAAGSFHDSLLSVAWPQAEFGGMGLEGAVRLGFKRELESLSSDQEREALFQSKFDEMMEQGKAISAAMLFEIDAVIDPDATREWILGALEVAGAFEPHGFLEPASSLKMAGSYTKGSASRTMASNGLSARFIDTW